TTSWSTVAATATISKNSTSRHRSGLCGNVDCRLSSPYPHDWSSLSQSPREAPMLKRLFAGLVAIMLLASPAMAPAITLTGTVTYYERMALPAGSQLRLRLVTLADNRQIASASSQITDRASPPIAFSMNLRSTSAATAGPLGLVAEIRANGQPLFRSAAPA